MPICGFELHTVYVTAFKGIVGFSPYSTENIPALKCEHCCIAIIRYDKTMKAGEFLKKCVKCGKEIPIASEECQHCGAKQKKGAKP
jgi:ribosomal protein L40E